MPVFYTGYNWLFYYKPSGSLDCLSWRMTAVRVVYITVRFSTLLTGEFICNCLYLNWLSNQSLAKRYHWKGGLADSCRGLSLLDWFPYIPRLSTHYGYSSVLVTYLYGRTKVRNACSVTTDGHHAPTATMSYWQNGVKSGRFLHHFVRLINSVKNLPLFYTVCIVLI